MKESVELLQQLFQVGDNVDSKYAALADLEIDNKEEDYSIAVKKFQARLEYLSRICLYNIYLRTGKIEEKTGGRSKDMAAIQLGLKECDEISEISDCAFTLLLSKPLKSEKATNLYPLPVKALFEHLKKSVIQYNEQCKTNVDNCVQWIDKVSQQREVLRSQADEDSQVAKLYLEDILSFISHLDLVTSEFKTEIYKNMRQFHERCLVLAPKQETIGEAEKKKRLARALQDFNGQLSSLKSKINTIEGIVLVSDDQLGSRKEIEAYFDI